MNYRFENTYTQSELVKWHAQATSLLTDSQSTMSLTSSTVVIFVQFCLWAPIFYLLYSISVPLVWMAPILFLSYVAIGIFYDAVLMPHVAAMFDKEAREARSVKFESVIEVDEDAVRSFDGGQEITFKWGSILDIHDSASSVIFLTEKGYCLIPARCFSGFLAKDAFVRDCVEKIKGRTEQGAVFV